MSLTTYLPAFRISCGAAANKHAVVVGFTSTVFAGSGALKRCATGRTLFGRLVSFAKTLHLLKPTTLGMLYLETIQSILCAYWVSRVGEVELVLMVSASLSREISCQHALRCISCQL